MRHGNVLTSLQHLRVFESVESCVKAQMCRHHVQMSCVVPRLARLHSTAWRSMEEKPHWKLIYQFSRQKSLKKNNNIKVNIPELSYQLGLVDNSIQIQHLGLEFFARQREGVGHQPLGCKRVEVEESQEIRNSAGGRTFQQHSAVYPPQVQCSASISKPCKRKQQKVCSIPMLDYHGRPRLPEGTSTYHYVSPLLWHTQTAKDAATRRASWVRAVLTANLWMESQVNMSNQNVIQLVTRVSTEKSEAPGAWQKPNHQVEFWKASGLQPRQTGDPPFFVGYEATKALTKVAPLKGLGPRIEENCHSSVVANPFQRLWYDVFDLFYICCFPGWKLVPTPWWASDPKLCGQGPSSSLFKNCRDNFQI